MCDCDRPAVLIEKAVVARTPKRCCECGRTIESGELYARSNGVWEGRGSTHHTCAECAETFADYIADLPHGYCYPAFGELREALESI